jgi:hypothetical protein
MMTGGRFIFVIVGIGMEFVTEKGFATTPFVDQSGGNDSSGLGVVAQPARKIIAPQKMIPAVLNTRQLCGTKMRTQAFTIYD